MLQSRCILWFPGDEQNCKKQEQKPSLKRCKPIIYSFSKCYKIVLLSINTVIKYGAYFLVVKITANYNNKYIINLHKKLHAVVAGLNF